MAVALENHMYTNRSKKKYRRRRAALALMLAVILLVVIGYFVSKSINIPLLLEGHQPIKIETAGHAGMALSEHIGLNNAFAVQFAQQVKIMQNNEQANNINAGSGSGQGQPTNGGNTNAAVNSGTQEEAKKPVQQNEKYVALTFDDGPDLKYTTAILDILKDKGVKATFFVVGQQVGKYPEVMKRIVDEGHAVGNHSYNHPNMKKLDRAKIEKEIDDTDALIYKAIGFNTDLFRAPYGAVSDTLKDVMKKKERHLIGWNIDTRDWDGTSPAEMRAMIKDEAKAGSIILMHSFGGKHIQNTVEALPGIIDDLKEMGFTLATINEMP